MSDAQVIERMAEVARTAPLCDGPRACRARGNCAECHRLMVLAVLAALASPDIPAEVVGRLVGVEAIVEIHEGERTVHADARAVEHGIVQPYLVRVAPERAKEERDAD